MGAEFHNFPKDAAASYLGWWRDAGADAAVCDEPHDWLGTRHVHAQPDAARPVYPGSLADFTTWLATAEIPEAGPARHRVSPAGNPAGGLMILADFPDREDVAAHEPLSGELGSLFELMLRAIARTRQSVYVAMLCPGRPPTGLLDEAAIAALAPIARHHIALAAPSLLWLMGSAASRAILGVSDADARGKLHVVNLNGCSVKAIATAHPRMFGDSKSRKAAAWTEMQRLIEKEPA